MFKHVIPTQQKYFLSKKIELKKEREETVYQKVNKKDIENLKNKYTKIFAAGPNANLNVNLLDMLEETPNPPIIETICIKLYQGY